MDGGFTVWDIETDGDLGKISRGTSGTLHSLLFIEALYNVLSVRRIDDGLNHEPQAFSLNNKKLKRIGAETLHMEVIQ